MKLTTPANALRKVRFQCVLALLAFGTSAAFAADTTSTNSAAATAKTSTTTTKSKAKATASTTDPKDTKDMKQISAPAEKPESPIKFRLGVPAWASAVSGEVGVRGRVTPAQYISFSDLWNHLDYVVPGSIGVDYGKWGVLLEGQYVKLTENLNTKDVLFNAGSIDMEQAFFDFNISYKVVDTDKVTIAPFIGTRFEYLRLHGELSPTTLNPVKRPYDDSVDTAWADPILGFSARFRVFKPTSIIAKADVGGFGAASHLTYELFGGVETQLTRNFYVSTGYRYLETDYSSGGFTYNMAFGGPQITFGVNF